MLIANHPFGGAEGIARCRTLIDRLRQDPAVPRPCARNSMRVMKACSRNSS